MARGELSGNRGGDYTGLCVRDYRTHGVRAALLGRRCQLIPTIVDLKLEDAPSSEMEISNVKEFAGAAGELGNDIVLADVLAAFDRITLRCQGSVSS